MRRVLLLAPLLFGFAAAAVAGETLAGKDVGERLMRYYQRPDPVAAIGWLPRLDPAAMAGDEAVDVYAVFYLHLLKANPQLAFAFVDAAAAGAPGAVQAAAMAVWLADLPGKEALVDRLAARLPPERLAEVKATAPFDREHLAAASPHDLDLLWTSFFATGDTEYVRVIVGYLPYLLPKERVGELMRSRDPNARRQAEAAMLGLAAAWSLSANARTHPPVRAVLTELAGGDDAVGKAAKGLLERQGR